MIILTSLMLSQLQLNDIPPLQPTMPPFPPAALAALGDPSKLPSGAPHLNPVFLQDMAQGGNMVRGVGGGGEHGEGRERWERWDREGTLCPFKHHAQSVMQFWIVSGNVMSTCWHVQSIISSSFPSLPPSFPPPSFPPSLPPFLPPSLPPSPSPFLYRLRYLPRLLLASETKQLPSPTWVGEGSPPPPPPGPVRRRYWRPTRGTRPSPAVPSHRPWLMPRQAIPHSPIPIPLLRGQFLMYIRISINLEPQLPRP